MILLFWPGLVGSQVPAFRDAYHFYYPQAFWLDSCLEQGELFPRWNRFEGLGSSVPGQVSSGLYYPLRVLWLFPGLSLPQRYSLVIVVHLLLAAAGMRYAATKLGLGRLAGMLSAGSYALSCPVLFQQYNLIYLCSAAWIGFALGALVERFSSRARTARSYLRSLMTFCLATSLMLLAGDPQTAVHCWLIISFTLLLKVLWRPEARRLFVNYASWLAIASLLIAAVTSVQWLPAWRWSQQSRRVAQDATSVAEHQLMREHQEVIQNLSELQLSPMRRYEFSLSPWHLGTLFWPTLGGHYQPQNSRLFALIGSEGRMWIPSIYFGILPCLLVFWGWRQGVEQRWLLWLAAFSLAAAFGFYSPVWLLKEGLLAVGWDRATTYLPSDQSFSVFGMLTALIPGYESFRYPAKWSVWFAAAMSLYAACSFDHLLRASPGRRSLVGKWWSRILVLASLVLLSLGLLILAGPLRDTLLRRAVTDPWLGAPSPEAIAKSIGFSSVLVMVAILIQSWLAKRSPQGMLACLCVEMLLVGGLWCQFVAPPEDSADLCRTSVTASSSKPMFIWADVTEANLSDFTTAGDDLLTRQKQLQDRFLVGKLSAICKLRNLSAAQSIEPEIVEKLRLWLAWKDTLASNQPSLDATLAELGVTHRLAFQKPGSGNSSAAKQLALVSVPLPEQLCDLVAGPMPETPTESTGAPEFNSLITWSWLRSDCLKIQFQTSLPRPAKLIVRQLNDGGWQAGSSLFQDELPENQLELQINPPTTPFIEIAVPAGCRQITLKRKWLW